jgi:hypothetical protein
VVESGFEPRTYGMQIRIATQQNANLRRLFNCSPVQRCTKLCVSESLTPQLPPVLPPSPPVCVIVAPVPLCFCRFALIMHHYCKWTKRHAAFQELLDVAALQVQAHCIYTCILQSRKVSVLFNEGALTNTSVLVLETDSFVLLNLCINLALVLRHSFVPEK